ncbi:hypothetical protein [Aquimarina algiphila]|uniref:DUF4149 domain-containing protein n=1 Tax=Aquimarina algiphila TaxID=2047982 RepID=A0A554VF54_9FLAO|nr:hypothetical protein [Aquimarina algiphila]TSE05776.1 hypothetical protein FOF46_21740 [Aquimarina algiphila]
MKKIYDHSFVLTFIWVGFLLAISFMEAPLKFQAPSVTTAIGVDIGKIVFGALNKVEIFFSLFFALQIVRIKKLDSKLFLGLLVLFIIIIIQSFYLLPILDAYAEIVINGGKSPSNTEHIIYVVLEISKLFLLLYIGYKQIILFKKKIKNHS